MSEAKETNGQNTVQTILRSAILVKPENNMRSGDFTADAGIEENHAFEQLVASLKDHGQRNPVIVRPIKSQRYQYELVAGYRRMAALDRIASERAEKDQKVLVTVMASKYDSDAIAENARENIERQDVKPADKAWSVKAYKAQVVKEGRYTTDTAISFALGLSQGYTSKLLVVAEKLRDDLFDLWRSQPRPLELAKVVEIAKLSPDEQPVAWAAELKEPESGKPKQPKSPFEKAQAKVEKNATLLGVLHGLEALDCSQLKFQLVIDTLAENEGEAISGDDKRKLVAAAKKAFKDAIRSLEEPAEEEEEATN